MKAFPHIAKAHYLDGNTIVKEEITSGGMDLRDYFAAKAMQSLTERSGIREEYTQRVIESYKIADAMMKAREQK